MRISQVVTVSLITLAMASTASAQRRPGLGGKYSARNMTAAQNSLTILNGPTSTQLFGATSGVGGGDVGINYTSTSVSLGDEDETFTYVDYNIGGAYGITPELEAGIFIPLAISSPDGVDRDALGNPMVFATYAKDLGNFDVGGRIGLTLPVQDGSDPGLLLGVPFLFRFGNSRLDTGVFIPLVFGDDETVSSLNLPVRFTQSVTPKIYVGGETGVLLPDFETDSGSIPLKAVGGYTMLISGNVIDFGLSIGFPYFLSFVDGAENPVTDTLQFDIGANLQMAF